MAADGPDMMVRASGLAKSFGEVEAVRGVDLEVAPGELFGLLGPNGAGKSTLIGMLSTLITPTAGTGAVAGFDIVRERPDVRRSIGLVFQEQTLDRYLTGWYNLKFHAEIYGVPSHEVEERVTRALEDVGLWEERERLAGTYSGGMRRRLEIARGLLHRPRLLFLDEPTAGLDPRSREAIWDRVRELNEREGITVLMTTHYLEEAENCGRIAIIDGGQIVTVGTPAELKAQIGQDRVEIVARDPHTLGEELRTRLGLTPVVQGDTVWFTVAGGRRFVPRVFSEVDAEITSVQVKSPSLDDVFLARTGRGIDGPAPGGAEPQAGGSRR
ncbi:ATP-binding cassette domain-containing protein [Nocardiopsis sp. CT-R113]|uniref:ATP-binding cassette domain-containing protein n=1 Tax=Nocardiopsis codii TaxID=3065942 RepID=A0ABU7KIE0_9ACTN|nr:ATP-binding cassette domain-containing protein [Nocardiopsis sp. CT-R113]MEE2041699.1 ATP-binding cassette domain-containing protein [Nocardiopsis sp. CT-R113]